MSDYKCLMQGGEKVSPEWCDLAQYQEVCGQVWGRGKKAKSCDHNQMREKSKYQRQKEKAP